MELRQRSLRTGAGCVPSRSSKRNGARVPSTLSLPGLTRQSINLRKDFFAKKMDARVKPAHDELGKLPFVSLCTITFLFRRAVARGMISFASLTRIEGWAERRETFGCVRGTRGHAMTRRTRRLRGALRPITRDARLSALHRGGFRLRGRACLTGIYAGSVTASSSHPGRSAWRAGSRASRGKRLQAAAAGRHASLRIQDRL